VAILRFKDRGRLEVNVLYIYFKENLKVTELCDIHSGNNKLNMFINNIFQVRENENIMWGHVLKTFKCIA
jgi:hypothetical protein